MKYTLTITGCCAATLVFGLMIAGQAAVAGSGAKSCADPAANIELALISKSGPSTGRVRITAVVKNLGDAAWTASGPGHHLQMLLTRRDAGTPPDGEPLQPPVAIRQLAPGQQYRIDYQTNWDAEVKASRPRFIARFFEAGRAGAPSAPSRNDCRADNNRRVISVADIDKLFQPAPPATPLVARSYRLLGGVGVNTVEMELAYRRNSSNTGKLTASVAAPYTGASDDVPLNGDSGTAIIRVHIPCDTQQKPGTNPPVVTITYRLWSALGLPGGGAGWLPGFSVEQSIPYRELCGPGPADKSRP